MLYREFKGEKTVLALSCSLFLRERAGVRELPSTPFGLGWCGFYTGKDGGVGFPSPRPSPGGRGRSGPSPVTSVPSPVRSHSAWPRSASNGSGSVPVSMTCADRPSSASHNAARRGASRCTAGSSNSSSGAALAGLRNQCGVAEHHAGQQGLLLPGARQRGRQPGVCVRQRHVCPVRPHRRPSRPQHPAHGCRPGWRGASPPLQARVPRPGGPPQGPAVPCARPGSGPWHLPLASRSAAPPSRHVRPWRRRRAGPCCPPGPQARLDQRPLPPTGGSGLTAPSRTPTPPAHGPVPAPIPAGPGSGGGRRRPPGTSGPSAASARPPPPRPQPRPGCAAWRHSGGRCGGPPGRPGVCPCRGPFQPRHAARVRQRPRSPARPWPCRASSAVRAPRRPRPGCNSDTASSRLVLPEPFGPVTTDMRAAGRQVRAGIIAELSQGETGEPQHEHG